MDDALMLCILLVVYSVAVVHALAAVSLRFHSLSYADVGPIEGF